MGFSERVPAGDYSRERQGRRILALVAAMGIRPVLVAHYFGAAQRDLPLLLSPLQLRKVLISAPLTNPLASAPLLKSFLYHKDVAMPEMIALLQRPMNQPGSTVTLARWLPDLLLPPA